jgi:branched-chain amino acid transport system permease protein
MRSPVAATQIRRFLALLALMAVVELITGPPGSAEEPTIGITRSFSEPTSFFGLFVTPRFVLFFAFTVIIYLVAWLWRSQSTSIVAIWNTTTAQPRAFTQRRTVRLSTRGGLLVIAIVLPLIVTDPFWQSSLVEQIAVYILLALGLNVVTGFAGLLDLGYVAFYAIGAYATAWVTGALPLAPPFGIHMDPFFAIPIAIVLAMVAGVILGAPTLRLRGDYLAIVTLGFGEIIALFANNLNTITGGATGTNEIPHFTFHVGPVNYRWGLGPVPYYYLALGFVVIFIVAFSLLEHSRVGRAWTAIREDEVAAESVGINPLKYKVMAFAIGAASAGFAGVMTAAQTNFVSPATFTLVFSINILVLVIFGGMGSIAGVILGAVLVQNFQMFIIHTPPAGFQPQDLYIYLGAILVAMMIFRPAGLLPSRRRRRELTMAEVGKSTADEILIGEQS